MNKLNSTQSEQPDYTRLPRWRGFNLLEKFIKGRLEWNQPYYEWDLDFIAEWGFDFIRLPTDYRIWTISPGEYDEKPLKDIDQVIQWARQRKIHVNLCLHRGPGYCVNPPKEELDLWGDDSGSKKVRLLFADQWRMFAQRYKGITSSELSFDLINEPPLITGEQYARGVAPAIQTIREVDPTRLIIADGTNFGRSPVPELAPFKIAQSTRGYDPFVISHYKAQWVKDSDKMAEPTWPLEPDYGVERLWKDTIEPWTKFIDQNKIGVHVGEWGAHHFTPHPVVLGWMKDCLVNWKKAGFGWALWNLRGSFGIFDSLRQDVQYEDYQGHKLDRKMFELLKEG